MSNQLVVKLNIEYDGTCFHGWQRQTGVKTIQGELESALKIFINSLARKYSINLELPEKFEIYGSGRTDAGVHARGQVAHLIWPEALPLDTYKLKNALTGMTSSGVVVKSASIAPYEFHARFSPHIKCYQYRMLLREKNACFFDNRVWCIGSSLSIPRMIESAKVFKGLHDFQSFRAKDCTAKSTLRTIIDSEIYRYDSDLLIYRILGKGFLKQMVRIIVGTLVDIGKGKKEPADLAGIIDAKKRSLAGETAPGNGLCLEWVRYDMQL